MGYRKAYKGVGTYYLTMLPKENALRELKEIQQEYEKWKNNKEFISNEKQICESLIKPFIKKVLGWNTSDFSEFKVEYSERGKRMDMLVCLDGISQFIIEAKALTKEIIDNREFYNQAINYAHSKEKTFAILTNFKHWVVLRCDIAVPFPERAQIGVIDLTDFEQNRFDKLVWNFNRENWIERGNQNPLYLELGNLKKKRPIDEQLLEDMKNWRMSFLTNLKKYPRRNHFKLENEKEIMHIEEEIQRFIDRLIFICYCEDKELNEPRLKSLKIDKYQRFSGKPFLLDKIRELFNDYRKEYDSDLFNVGMCDGFYVDDSILFKLLEDLREPKEKIPYDFASIEVDILGRTYENFIGHLIKGKKIFKEEKSKGKRKEEGIYYTPQYIVNYIVNNTVRELIKGKSYEEIKKIKILDPACGSGSFLIKIFDVLIEECSKKLKRELDYNEKEYLLLNCIYGVDKDERACDIAKLNLSLKLAEKGKKLPELHNNIRNGDSLIENKDIADYLAFEWEKEFKDILSNGMFDIIIGNPPYGAKFNEKETEFLLKNYSTNEGELESFKLFIEKGISLLKNNGKLGFIVPNTWLYISRSKIIREFLLNKTKIFDIVELAKYIFKDAPDMVPAIVIFEKENNFESILKNKCKVKAIPLKGKKREFLSGEWRINSLVEQKVWLDNEDKTININLDNKTLNLLYKIVKDTLPLNKFSIVKYGIKTGNNEKYISEKKERDNYKKCLLGRNIGRYVINWDNKYLNYGKLLDGYRTENIEVQKILVQYTRKLSLLRRIVATLDEKGEYYPLNSLSYIYSNSKLSNFVLLGVLNSKLMNFYFANTYIDIGIKPVYLVKLPIKNQLKNMDVIEKKVKSLLELNEKIKKTTKSNYENSKLKKDIGEIENQIDQEVYNLYGLTDSEIKIVEDSLK